MFVCICKAVPKQNVAEAISSGAHSVEDVTRACRAGGDCGACHAMIDDMIEDHLTECGALRGGARAELLAVGSLVR